MDFESSTIDGPTWRQLSDLLIRWGAGLQQHGLELSVWTGGPTWLDLASLNATSAVGALVTMDTYGTASLEEFRRAVEGMATAVALRKAGFGFLVGRTPLNQRNMDDVCTFAKQRGVKALSFYADSIPSKWMQGAAQFLK